MPAPIAAAAAGARGVGAYRAGVAIGAGLKAAIKAALKGRKGRFLKVTTPGIDAMIRKIDRDPKMRQDLGTKWADDYRRFIRSRFYFYSRGQGDWAKLSRRRLREKKRSGRDGRSMGILRFTNRLFNSLKPELKNQSLIQTKVLKTRMRLIATLDGPGQYSSGTTLAEVAQAHQAGSRRLPQRKILVPPDEKTERVIDESGKKIVVRHLNKAKAQFN